jgi:CDP-glucose 4,6-dehydratase
LTVADVISVVKGGWPELCVECVDDQRDFHETHTLKLDCSKSSRDLEWKPVWVPRTSIERTIDWYKDYYYKNQIITTLQLQQFVQDAHSLNCIWTR